MIIVLKIEGLKNYEIDFPEKEKVVEPIEKSRFNPYDKRKPRVKEPGKGDLIDITV
ncbi:MAG: hypothetical protein UT05_C0006G0044 [Parcubacteria group bacterium GW2011_GWF2_38_76]|nr:MAG: hypothetical protein UT05_C0006G0044 [Parcubacteria group bacterium GW2011_GWF2_38_76]